MTGAELTTQACASLPAMGKSVPTAVAHVCFLVVSVGLCLLVLESPFWLGVGLLCAVAGTFLSSFVPRPCVILVLALSQFWREPSVTDFAYYLLLAGVHLLFVLGSFAQQMPWNGRIQAVALFRTLKRWALVQSVVQAAAIGALFVFSSGSGTVPGLSIVAVVVLGGVSGVLGWRLRLVRVRE